MLRKFGILLACWGALGLLAGGQFAAAADKAAKSESTPAVAKQPPKVIPAGSTKDKTGTKKMKGTGTKPAKGIEKPKTTEKPGKKIDPVKLPHRPHVNRPDRKPRNVSGKGIAAKKTTRPVKDRRVVDPSKPAKAAPDHPAKAVPAKASKLKVKPAIYRVNPAVNGRLL